MNNAFDNVQAKLRGETRTWLVTGAAGFIGSNLVEALLKLDQRVVGLDDFATGHRRNLGEVEMLVTPAQWSRFRFQEGDICDLDDCRAACVDIDYVLHQAALGSVPRSLQDPLRSHASNVDGFLNMALAARDAKVRRFVYASSSSVYGDHPALPKLESNIGRPLSPYAATKYINEIYADVFSRSYGMSFVGLRYFNVFGPRQDPDGAYAAVIPKWFAAVIKGEEVIINGDGETSRDFCYIENVVQANVLSAVADLPKCAIVLNIACGERNTLNQLFAEIRRLISQHHALAANVIPLYRAERAGDVRHSLADIRAAYETIGYRSLVSLREGLNHTYSWYRNYKSAPHP